MSDKEKTIKDEALDDVSGGYELQKSPTPAPPFKGHQTNPVPGPISPTPPHGVTPD